MPAAINPAGTIRISQARRISTPFSENSKNSTRPPAETGAQEAEPRSGVIPSIS
jgi:hypothetical protein